MKRLFGLLLLVSILAPMVGCEAHGKVDTDDHDHDLKVKVDKD